jgi:putative transposase
VIKLLWLAIRDIEDKRARARAKEKGLSANERRAPAKLVEGATPLAVRPLYLQSATLST